MKIYCLAVSAVAIWSLISIDPVTVSDCVVVGIFEAALALGVTGVCSDGMFWFSMADKK